jgi:hypothetical protein
MVLHPPVETARFQVTRKLRSDAGNVLIMPLPKGCLIFRDTIRPKRDDAILSFDSFAIDISELITGSQAQHRHA